MPSLKDIAKKVGDLTVAYAPINKNTQAPKRGNLKNKLKTANTPNKILSKNAEKPNIVQDVKYGIEFNINYAPPGAKYGKFVEEGHRTRKKPGGRGKSYVKPNPFAQKAVNDSSVKKMIKDYTKELSKEIKNQILQEFKKA
jgi:hypothetical protein